MPEDLLPLVTISEDGAPTTTNDAALSQRVRRAMLAGMGEDAFVDWYQSDMGAEDFPDLVNIEPPMRNHNEQAQLIMSQKKADLKSAFKNSPANPKNRKVAGENLEEQAFLSRVSYLGQPGTFCIPWITR